MYLLKLLLFICAENIQNFTSTFLKYMVGDDYLWVPYCRIASQRCLFLSNYNLVSTGQPFPIPPPLLLSLTSNEHYFTLFTYEINFFRFHM
jgi:hypothetical protein